MTFDEFLRLHKRGAKAKLHRATGVSMPTLRKMERRERVRMDAAWKVAVYLKCDPETLAEPVQRTKRASRKRAKDA